jgi:hypothetical protein
MTDKIDGAALRQLVEANRGKRGFTYTHYPLIPHNVQLIREANENGFTINVSANSPRHADMVAKHGLPTVTVLPADVDGAVTPVVYTPGGLTISVCPATYRDDISCGGGNGKSACELCQRHKRKSIVGFPAHGSGARKASETAKG